MGTSPTPTSAGDVHPRREWKYPLSADELLRFRWWQRGHGGAFFPSYAPRIVNNIYFDSPDWDSYADNMDGVSDRSKCRLRWYGELETAEVATFEVKHRRNATGHKRQQRILASELPLRSLPVVHLYPRLRMLLRPELRDSWDLTIFVKVTGAPSGTRLLRYTVICPVPR